MMEKILNLVESHFRKRVHIDEYVKIIVWDFFYLIASEEGETTFLELIANLSEIIKMTKFKNFFIRKKSFNVPL